MIEGTLETPEPMQRRLLHFIVRPQEDSLVWHPRFAWHFPQTFVRFLRESEDWERWISPEELEKR
jgi:hypothetical protein